MIRFVTLRYRQIGEAKNCNKPMAIKLRGEGKIKKAPLSPERKGELMVAPQHRTYESLIQAYMITTIRLLLAGGPI